MSIVSTVGSDLGPIGGPQGRVHQACELPYAEALLRDTPAEDGYDIRTLQELLGHADVSTMMIFTHVTNKGAKGVRSPLDRQPGLA